MNIKKAQLLSGLYLLFIVMAGNLASAQESANRNFYLENWKSKSYNSPDETIALELETGQAVHTIQLSLKDTIAPFLSTQLGLNTTFRSGSDMLNKRLDNYINSNMGAFRFPAGSGSNLYFWDGNIPENFLVDINPIDATQNSALKVSEFAVFIDSVKAEATVTVNYFYARYGFTESGTREARVNQAAEYAAGFVNYFNNELKAGIKNWEIGNECYGNWEEGYDVNGSIVTGKEYGEDLRVFAEKMKAVDPSIKIGAVMYPKSDDWNDQVMKEVKNHADFLVVHNYFTSENDATVENILASTGQVTDIKQQMEACIERNTTFPKDHFPVSMTEYNCRGPHTTTFINACFTADVIGKFIENNYGLATRWVGEWKWKVGTHGLFAQDDPDQVDYSVRQAYMMYHYFGKCFGDQMVNASTSNNELTVYGSTFSDGKTGLVVINPTSENMQFNVGLNSGNKSGKVYLYEVYANSIAETDKKFYVNGLTSETVGGGPEHVETISPYKANYSENSIFAVKKYSVSFLVFDSSDIATSSTSIEQNSDFSIYPVPASNELNFANKEAFNSIKIFNSNGKMILHSAYKNPLNISEIPNGFYLLNMYSSNFVSSKTFIKKNN
ncbi:MAG: T9SS type A sorting domain-containing protein [Bacteroidetes bacterium]|nr:T9SS type A sorting domain-containing protein [Bacteroidota bacterium]